MFQPVNTLPYYWYLFTHREGEGERYDIILPISCDNDRKGIRKKRKKASVDDSDQ